MRKLQLKATELVDTDVNFVSLVERGANRIPFRIIKEEEQMLDLHKIGRSLFRKAEPKPEIVAVITQKGADPEKVLEVIKTAGLDPTEFMATEKDGILTFAKTDADKAEGTMVVRVNETVGVVVSGLQKAFDGFEFSSTSFSDVMASGSFCSSVCTATDMLNATIGNILAYAESADQAADEINKAVGEYQSYVVTLAKGLPVHAFKADVAFTRTSLAAGPAPAASPEVTAEVTESATETVPEPVETAKSETNEEEVEKTKDRMEEVEAEKPNEKQPDELGEDRPCPRVG